MANKVKKIREEIQKKQKEIEDTQKKLEEEIKILEEKKEHIHEEIHKLEGDDFFVGVILTEEDLFEIIKLMIKKQEPVRIPFNVYINVDSIEK